MRRGMRMSMRYGVYMYWHFDCGVVLIGLVISVGGFGRFDGGLHSSFLHCGL